MNKHLMLKCIAEHFNSVTPDFVVGKLKELGCEFDDMVSYHIKPTHMQSHGLKAPHYSYIALAADASGIKKTTSYKSKFLQLDFGYSLITHSSNDEAYAEMNEAA